MSPYKCYLVIDLCGRNIERYDNVSKGVIELSDLNLIDTLKICTITFLPIVLCLFWLLPKLLNSQRKVKIFICASLISVFILATVILTNNIRLPVQKIQYVVIFVVTFWGVISWFIVGYYDIRLRKKLGSAYYSEMLRFQIVVMKYLTACFILSLILGLITGSIAVIVGDSIWGIILSLIAGSIYGSILGILLDYVTVSVEAPPDDL